MFQSSVTTARNPAPLSRQQNPLLQTQLQYALGQRSTIPQSAVCHRLEMSHLSTTCPYMIMQLPEWLTVLWKPKQKSGQPLAATVGQMACGLCTVGVLVNMHE